MTAPVVIAGAEMSVQNRLTADEGKLLTIAQNFNPFLVDWQMKRPNSWRDLIPYDVFPLYSGESQQTNIFRGTLGVQSGMSGWERVKVTKKPGANDTGTDMCTWTPRTYDWAYDSMDFEGFKTSWKSPNFCVNDLLRVNYAKEQLGMIIKAGSIVTDDTRETFSRETYMRFASEAGRCVVLAEGATNFVDDDSYRFTFDPFELDGDDQVIRFPAALLPKVSALNWSYLDFIRTYMAEQCPGAAMAQESGMPIFTLMLDIIDFEKFVLTDSELREDFRRAIPQRLIEGFNMGFKVYRGFSLSHDVRQARFAFKTIDTNSKAVLKRVNPRRAIRAGVVGLVPEANPDYIKAEFGTAVVFLRDVYTILVPPVVTSLGQGMTFSEGAPAFNGQWAWINNKSDANPLGEFGHFFARFTYYPKPLEYAGEAIIMLYRRCPQAISTGCAIDVATDVGSGAIAIAAAPAAADFSAANRTVVVTLVKKLAGGLGDAVTITNDAGLPIAANIADSSLAPTYTLAWANGATNAPSAVTEMNDPAITKVALA